MARKMGRKIADSNYEGVYKHNNGTASGDYWYFWKQINGVKRQGSRKTERLAALAVDLFRIEMGMEPVNILKRKL